MQSIRITLLGLAVLVAGCSSGSETLTDTTLGELVVDCTIQEENVTNDMNVTNCDFSGMNLSGMDLLGAEASGANFSGTNLTGAFLDRAGIYDTNFTGADLTSTDCKP